MINAHIILENNVIKITCTDNIKIYWTCDAQGSFKLDKYSGELVDGEDTINIISYPNIEIRGYVEFVFNGEHCTDKWKINIQGEGEKYYFYVRPTNVKLNGKGSTSIISIDASETNWIYTLKDSQYFSVKRIDNTLVITSLTDKEFTNIELIVSDNITQKTVYVSQEETKECILECIKTPDSGTTYQISVTSYQGNVFVPYNVDSSLLTNFKYYDNKQGIINVYVNDILQEANGKMIITNNCGKKSEIDFSYIPQEVKDEKFVIVNKPNEYTSVTINFTDIHEIQWNGSQVNMPYNNVNSLNILSYDKNGNFCNWQPISYNSDKILLQYDENTLELSLIDNNKIETPEIIILQNDCGKQIIISYTVSDGLIVHDEYVFLVGDSNGENKGNEYNIDYNETDGVQITLDSFLRQNGVESDIPWNCVSTDPVANYNVNPMNFSGGINNKVEILCDANILDQLENDYVGVVKFQQLDGEYLETKVNISHKGKPKEWYEVDRKLISIAIQPSVVELSPCQEINYSEEIFCKGVYEVIYELKTSPTSDTSYATKTEYVDDLNGRFEISWSKSGSEEINIETLTKTDSQGTYYTYRCYAPKNSYNVGMYRSTTFNGSVNGDDTYDLKLLCNQDTSSLTDETTKSDGEIVGTNIGIEIKDTNYDGQDDIIPRPGDTRKYYGMSVDIKYNINRVDSCGNEIPGFGTSEIETISEGVEFKSSPENMFNLNVNNGVLEILENPWEYTFNPLNGTEINVQALDENEYKKQIHSSRDVEPRIGYVWAEYQGMQSEKIEYQQEGGHEFVEYRLISKPDWCNVNLPSKFDFETEIRITFNENLIEQERVGEIILEQLLPDGSTKKQIKYTVKQAAAIFEFVFVQNNSTNYETNIEWVEGTISFDIKSIVNNHSCDYTYNTSDIPSWVTLDKNENNYVCNVSYNRDTENERQLILQFTQKYSNRIIIFKLLQDAMVYIPMNGCEEAPVLISSGFIVKTKASPFDVFMVHIRCRNLNLKDVTLNMFRVDTVKGRLQLYPIPIENYNITVCGGSAQQAYSEVLNDDTISVRQRSCGSHWFSAINKSYLLEIHEMHIGNKDNDTWYSDNFPCSLQSTQYNIFGFIKPIK